MKFPRITHEYQVCTSASLGGISDAMRTCISAGWSPQGGIATYEARISNGTNYETRTFYHQAMTRRKLTWA